MEPIRIGPATLTMEALRQAELIFQKIHSAPCFRQTKLKHKWDYFQQVYAALRHASYRDTCVAYDRNAHKMSQARLQVIDALTEAGFVRNIRSKPGSPKCSRLLPLSRLEESFTRDPWSFDADRITQYVYLRRRRTEEEVEFDSTDPIPANVQSQLECVNEVNSAVAITYSPFDDWADRHIGVRHLRPIHYARFTDDWHHHGRLYTGKYGHQGLRANERQWIRFDGLPSVEIDYAGLHPRMLYHRRGIDFRDDPYRLFEPHTTPAQRLLAKTVINTAINARDRRAAISACTDALNSKTRAGGPKTGKAARDAAKLRDALDETGLTFAALYDRAREHHAPISEAFGSDMGIGLMNIDGKIALDILFHFTSAGVPCLGVHDSFIVPECFRRELEAAMTHFYLAETGFPPVLNSPF